MDAPPLGSEPHCPAAQAAAQLQGCRSHTQPCGHRTQICHLQLVQLCTAASLTQASARPVMPQFGLQGCSSLICIHMLSHFQQLPSPPLLSPRLLTPTHTSLQTVLVSLGQEPRPPFLRGELTFGPFGILWPRGLRMTQCPMEVLTYLNIGSLGHK